MALAPGFEKEQTRVINGKGAVRTMDVLVEAKVICPQCDQMVQAPPKEILDALQLHERTEHPAVGFAIHHRR